MRAKSMSRPQTPLEDFQQAVVAKFTGTDFDLLKRAALPSGMELGGNAPLLQKLVEVGFLEAEPTIHNRILGRITPDGLAAISFCQSLPRYPD